MYVCMYVCVYVMYNTPHSDSAALVGSELLIDMTFNSRIGEKNGGKYVCISRVDEHFHKASENNSNEFHTYSHNIRRTNAFHSTQV